MSYNLDVRTLALTLLLGLLFRPAAAQNMEDVDIDHETWSVIGWNDGCGVAFEHYYYPKQGQALADEPISTKIGTASIAPGKEKYSARWAYAADGRLSWDERVVKKTEDDLKKGGYNRAGYPEIIQDAPIGNQPLLAETILSTGTLMSRVKNGWPETVWRWAGGNYSPLGTCALLVYENRTAPRHYRLFLVRVYNSRVRTDRAYAHASNARLLFNAGSLAIAAPEAETAAALDPDLPIGRYEHAAMLALTGNPNEAVEELAAAIKLDAKYGPMAAEDLDFADLRERPDFREMTNPNGIHIELNRE